MYQLNTGAGRAPVAIQSMLTRPLSSKLRKIGPNKIKSLFKVLSSLHENDG